MSIDTILPSAVKGLAAAAALLAVAASPAAASDRPNGNPIAPMAEEDAARALADPGTIIVSVHPDSGSTVIVARTWQGLIECRSDMYFDGMRSHVDKRVLHCHVLAPPSAQAAPAAR